MQNTLKKTAVAGGILGLALLTFLKTKKGQQVKKHLKNNLDDLYDDVGQKLQNLGDTSKEKYNEVVEKLVHEYAKKKMLAAEVAVDLTRELQKKWLTFQLYYLYSKVKTALNGEKQTTKTQFDTISHEVVSEYGKNKQLAKEEITKLSEEIKKKWKDFKGETSQQES